MEQSSCPGRNNEEIDSRTACRGNRMLLIGTLFHAYVFEWGSMCSMFYVHMCALVQVLTHLSLHRCNNFSCQSSPFHLAPNSILYCLTLHATD